MVKPGNAGREFGLDGGVPWVEIVAIVDPEQGRPIIAEPARAPVEPGEGRQVDCDERRRIAEGVARRSGSDMAHRAAIKPCGHAASSNRRAARPPERMASSWKP